MLDRTEQLKKLEEKGKNSITLVEIILFPAFQTSFSDFTIKFEQNIKSPTNERINSILFYPVVFIKDLFRKFANLRHRIFSGNLKNF